MEQKKYKFPNITISDAGKLWLQEIYSMYMRDISIGEDQLRQIHINLRNKIPSDFNPDSIDSRLLQYKKCITLLGIWHLNPETDLIQQSDKAFMAIKEILINNPSKRDIRSEDISKALDVSMKEAERILYILYSIRSEMFDGANQGRILWHYDSILVKNEKSFNNVLAYNGIEKHMEKFSRLFESSNHTDTTINEIPTEESVENNQLINSISATPIKSSEELVKIFDFDEDSLYKITPFKDSIGFHAERKYPLDIKFIPAKNKIGDVDMVALIKVLYNYQENNKKDFNSRNVPMSFEISCCSLYLRNKATSLYDFNDEKCPTKESLEESKKSSRPIYLSTQDFYLDHNTNKFYSVCDMVELKGKNLLDIIFREHCNSVQPFKNIPLKIKQSIQKIAIKGINKIISFIRMILSNVFDWVIEEDYTSRTEINGYPLKNFKRKSSSIFFDMKGYYKVSKRVFLLYVISIIIISIFYYNYESSIQNEIIKKMINNNWLRGLYAVLYLWILDDGIPYLSLFLINILMKIRAFVLDWQMKIRLKYT